MTQHHSFHLDQAGHSITADVSVGHTAEVDLLVDGKEVGYRHERGGAAITLSSELPGDPPYPFTVRIAHPRHRARGLACTLLMDGREIPMPEGGLAVR